MLETEILNTARYKLNDFLSTEKTASLKTAGMEEQFFNFVRKPYAPPVLTSIAGATGGAITGALQQLAHPEENRSYLGGALTGALGGGMAGAGLHYGLFSGDTGLTLGELIISGLLGGNVGSFTGHIAPTSKTASLNTADFLTRFGQDLGSFTKGVLPGMFYGGLLGGLYHDAAGDSPDNWLSNIGTGALIGGTLNGSYDDILTHLKISDKIKGLSDLITRRAATLSPDPSYTLRTDKLKSALDALMNGGFIKGFETFI